MLRFVDNYETKLYRSGTMNGTASEETQVTPDPRVTRSCSRLLDAATELLAEWGARAVTVDAIAERSGVAKSTMYRHYPSRTDLIVAVLRHNMPELETDTQSKSFDEALRHMVHGIAESMSDPDWARILPALMGLKHTITDVEVLTEADSAERLARLQNVLDLGIEESLIEPDTDPEMTLNLLVGPLLMAVMNGDLDRLGELADEVTDRYLTSCRARPGAQRGAM